MYLSHVENFQRHITTCAFKISGGVDLSASVSVSRTKQNSISTMFTNKITKAFLDGVYAILDGMMHLASVENITDIPARLEGAPVDAEDRSDPVCLIID